MVKIKRKHIALIIYCAHLVTFFRIILYIYIYIAKNKKIKVLINCLKHKILVNYFYFYFTAQLRNKKHTLKFFTKQTQSMAQFEISFV